MGKHKNISSLLENNLYMYYNNNIINHIDINGLNSMHINDFDFKIIRSSEQDDDYKISIFIARKNFIVNLNDKAFPLFNL